jgi:hypothetical protein
MQVPFYLLYGRHSIANMHRRQQAAFLSSILTSLPPTRAGIGSTNSPFSLDTILDTYQLLHNLVIGSLVVSVAGLLLGYYAFFFLVDGWGRRRIQFLAFAMLALLLAVLGEMTTNQEWPEESLMFF